MKPGKLISAIALTALFCLAYATSAEARNDAYKQANIAAVQMWLQQQAQQGNYYPDPYTAGRALQYQQMYGAPQYNGFGGYGPIYSPYNRLY